MIFSHGFFCIAITDESELTTGQRIISFSETHEIFLTVNELHVKFITIIVRIYTRVV